ncbi:MAG TPA: tRNA dihydrouridine synthase DusB [Gammaproteobacteria bacterium]|nr:tRNA dihydrouridine synthase DusB [Gammaproteobacteria bacterium]
MRIGPYQLKNNLVVAPMAGVTDRPFRMLCRALGAGLAVSEMVASNSLLWGSEKTKRRANHEGEPEPKSVQIVGANPALLAEAARHNVDNGAQIIDINMGCPAKKVCNVMAGSALLRDEPLVVRLLEAVVQAVEVPVTLKIRTGWDSTSRNGVRIAQLAEACGVQALSVHGRTRADAFMGDAEYDTIRDIKTAVSIPVIANGDINSPQKAKAVLEHTGVDGVMVGRAAQGRPWIFREMAHFLATGETLPEPSPLEVRDILLGHLENLYSFYGEELGVRVARKHIGWYSKGCVGGAAFRRTVNQMETPHEQRTLIEAFFAQQAELGAIVLAA